MRAAFMYGAGDVRIETVPDPVIDRPTDALVRVVAACICGSDLHPYRSMPAGEATPMGHKFIGPAPARAYIEELMPAVLDGSVRPGKVFDGATGLDGVPEGYRAMDRREALKVLIRP
jgi:threonine dehydrogenase-like Zn-dependent dehydrogenase